MSDYKASKANIHVVARCFLTNGENTILCRVKDANWYFLPGGHVENGESAKTTLLRELNEEIGKNEYTVTNFIGVCESIFQLNEKFLQQGVDIVYKVDTKEDFKIDPTREDHIEFVMVKTSELSGCNILPATLKEGILEYIKDGKIFLKDF